MPLFTSQELTDIVLIYGETGGNLNRSRRVYADRFPNRRIPSHTVIRNTIQNLRDRGEFRSNYEGRGRVRGRRLLNAEEVLLNMVEETPELSTRQAARQVHVSQSSVCRIWRNYSLHPYHIQRVQQLNANDHEARVRFCVNIRRRLARDLNFIRTILFTDESCFSRDGVFNYHNAHYWADANPRLIREGRFQHRFSVNVWAGIINNELIGPHILPVRLNGESYLNFLENVLSDYLENVPLRTRARMWYMLDGAPPHTARRVREFLNENYRHWIGRGGRVAWPARSPDLNPLDFFFWGYMKSLVYNDRAAIANEEDLRQRIVAAAEQIRAEIRETDINGGFIRRLEACIRARGSHFEHFI